MRHPRRLLQSKKLRRIQGFAPKIATTLSQELNFTCTPVTLPLIIVGDLFDAAMVVIRVPRQEAWVPLVGHKQTEPHDQVDQDEDVVRVRQQVPRDRDALGRDKSQKKELQGHQTHPQEVHGIRPEKNTAEEKEKRSTSSSALPKDQSPEQNR